MITFLTVPSSTIFGKQHVLVVCMILLVRLPSALTRLRGCFPQALLASAVRCGEGLLLPNGPSMAEGGGPQQRGPQRRGPPPPLPGVVRGCRAVPPEVGWGWGGGHPGFCGSLHGLHASDLKGCCFKSCDWEIFIPTLLKSFCSERFQVKCVSAHFS